MTQFNDSNWTGKTPRRLAETRLGPYGTWSAYHKDTQRKARIKAVAGKIGWAIGLTLGMALLLNIDRVAFFIYRSFS